MGAHSFDLLFHAPLDVWVQKCTSLEQKVIESIGADLFLGVPDTNPDPRVRCRH